MRPGRGRRAEQVHVHARVPIGGRPVVPDERARIQAVLTGTGHLRRDTEGRRCADMLRRLRTKF